MFGRHSSTNSAAPYDEDLEQLCLRAPIWWVDDQLQKLALDHRPVVEAVMALRARQEQDALRRVRRRRVASFAAAAILGGVVLLLLLTTARSRGQDIRVVRIDFPAATAANLEQAAERPAHTPLVVARAHDAVGEPASDPPPPHPLVDTPPPETQPLDGRTSLTATSGEQRRLVVISGLRYAPEMSDDVTLAPPDTASIPPSSASHTPPNAVDHASPGGFTAQTWDIAGSEASFFVHDITGVSKLPFRIRPGAPTESVDVSCDVTAAPVATLLLPYFETEFTITNTSETAQIAHVVLWSNELKPVLDFNVLLTGKDVGSLALYNVSERALPSTADELDRAVQGFMLATGSPEASITYISSKHRDYVYVPGGDYATALGSILHIATHASAGTSHGPLISIESSPVIAGSAQAQATRTWVSGAGDDANPCSRTAPCKTWAGVTSKTAAGGEINAFDFGAVTIDDFGSIASFEGAQNWGIVSGWTGSTSGPEIQSVRYEVRCEAPLVCAPDDDSL